MIEHILTAMALITWRDSLEILFFSYLIYALSLWLKKDRQKNILPYLLAYCFVLMCSFALHCTTITFALITFAPACLMFLFLIHQQTLQKNFITLQHIVPRTPERDKNWLELLLRTGLMALSNNKNVTIVIERSNTLQDFLFAQVDFKAPITKDLLTLIFESIIFEPEKIMWINADGTILGINSDWILSPHDEWLSADIKKIDTWQQKALFVSKKTDALMIKMFAAKKNATVCVGGKCIENVHIPQLLTVIQEHMQLKTVIKRTMHEQQNSHAQL